MIRTQEFPEFNKVKSFSTVNTDSSYTEYVLGENGTWSGKNFIGNPKVGGKFNKYLKLEDIPNNATERIYNRTPFMVYNIVEKDDDVKDDINEHDEGMTDSHHTTDILEDCLKAVEHCEKLLYEDDDDCETDEYVWDWCDCWEEYDDDREPVDVPIHNGRIEFSPIRNTHEWDMNVYWYDDTFVLTMRVNDSIVANAIINRGLAQSNDETETKES